MRRLGDRRRQDSHISDHDRFCVVRDIALASPRDRWEDAQGLVSVEGLVTDSDLRDVQVWGLHDGGEIRHVAVVLRAERILPGRVELVDLSLQARVGVRVRQQTVCDARERDRGRIGPCDDREDTIDGQVLHWHGWLVRQVFVVLPCYQTNMRAEGRRRTR